MTGISDANVVLETITSQKSYLNFKPAEKETTVKDTLKISLEVIKPMDNSVYKYHNDQTRETFVDRMVEDPTERGLN